MYALTQALQIELGISVPSDNFGTGTLSALSRYGNIGTGQNDSNQNIVKIIQDGLYCKGYSAGGITGTFGEQTSAAVVKMKQNMGVSAVDGLVTPKFFKALLTMDAYVLLSGGKTEIREIQQWLNNRYYTRKNYFFQPCDGYYSRNTQKALLFALQYEEGLDDATANGRFGPTTKSKLPTLTRGNSDSSTQFVHLLQAALIFNNRACPFHGTFDAMTLTAVLGFQNFTKLTVSGTVGKQTWASLLVSTGDPTRRGTACDCITEVTAARAQLLKKNGYTTVGRYLTNVKNSSLNKKIQKGELKTITDAGLSVFPIFRKALIQTAFAWEHTLEGLDDLTSDSMVTNYYAYKEQLEQWENLSAEQKALIPRPVAPAFVRTDSSTGLCQIFAATAIKACNYAISIGLIHERSYDQNNWHDLYEVWKKLHNDERNYGLYQIFEKYNVLER